MKSFKLSLVILIGIMLLQSCGEELVTVSAEGFEEIRSQYPKKPNDEVRIEIMEYGELKSLLEENGMTILSLEKLEVLASKNLKANCNCTLAHADWNNNGYVSGQDLVLANKYRIAHGGSVNPTDNGQHGDNVIDFGFVSACEFSGNAWILSYEDISFVINAILGLC